MFENLKAVVRQRIAQTGDTAAVAYRDVYYAINSDHYVAPTPPVNLELGFTIDALKHDVDALRDQSVTTEEDYEDFLRQCEGAKVYTNTADLHTLSEEDLRHEYDVASRELANIDPDNSPEDAKDTRELQEHMRAIEGILWP